MAINEQLNNRLRAALATVPNVTEKNMFRGTAFMVDDKMCISAGDQEIMCRIDPAIHDEMTAKAGCRTVIMRGRPYKGYVYVHEDVLKTKKDLSFWINLALDFNKHAKSSKKKAKK